MDNRRLTGVGLQGIADFTIDSLARMENKLRLSISYAGGCQQHYFDVAWDETVTQASPCRATLLVSHRTDDDTFSCSMALSETLEIDLEELFGRDNIKALSCAIDVFSIINGTIDPDITCCFR